MKNFALIIIVIMFSLKSFGQKSYLSPLHKKVDFQLPEQAVKVNKKAVASTSTVSSLFQGFVNANNSDAANENNFVNFLSLTNSGLTLMKGNAANNSWSQPIKNTNGSYSAINCN